MAQKQATRTNQAITLKGSTALVTEFFEYSVNRYDYLKQRCGRSSLIGLASLAYSIKEGFILQMISGQCTVPAYTWKLAQSPPLVGW